MRAWTENEWGFNFSSPYWQIEVNEPGQGWDVYYGFIPSKGTNVVLNLDNPVSTTVTPTVSGMWSPN